MKRGLGMLPGLIVFVTVLAVVGFLVHDVYKGPPPAPLAPARVTESTQGPVIREPDNRLGQENLDRLIARETRLGARLEARLENSAVLVYGKKVTHLLHFFICFLTCGLWVFVWLFLSMFGGEKRRTWAVLPDGNVVERG